ncbi:hypothetical protein FNJ88_11255 [Chryseobacterium sp. SNU WT5]|uniref:hypothetical protein n=1 Tax=Chryseobacterium sp. SNU WT5 TaxID=2594269 RepID=UPI001181543D|nr:hypothetical protein [Chryseobacterium sp. SNU WT5]QDP86096.1 hypothetical protein FNJ88_11255 [Chryseobacterium sp. SNU WT5]
MKENFADESPKKDLGFVLSLLALLLFTGMGIGIDFDEFSQHLEINIPPGYFYFIFLVDVIMIVSLIIIYNYRKIGAYLFPAAVITHFLAHNFFLSTFLYTDVTNMFLYITVGMFAILPKWQFFK